MQQDELSNHEIELGFFTDEKLFIVAPVNLQIYLVYARVTSKKRYINYLAMCY